MRSFYDLDILESQVFGTESLQEENTEEEETESGELNWAEVEEWELPEELKSSGPVTLTVTVDDETQVECQVLGVFLEGEKEYIALGMPEGEIQIMELGRGEDDGIRLIPVEDEEEQQCVIEKFFLLFGDGEHESEGKEERENIK